MGFESGIHYLKSNVRSSRNVPLQMGRKFLLAQGCGIKEHIITKPQGTLTFLPNEVTEQFPLAVGIASDYNSVAFHGRCVVNGRTYFSLIYRRGIARSSRFLKFYENGGEHFGEALFYFTVQSGEKYCVGRRLVIDTPLYSSSRKVANLSEHLHSYHFICNYTSLLFCIPSNSIRTRCCVLIDKRNIYVTPVLLDYELQ